MSIFGSKKKTSETKASKTVTTKAVTVAPVSHTPHFHSGMGASVIIRPHVTEKAHSSSEGTNVHVFRVSQGATKGMVSKAIMDLYKVTPLKVSIVPIPKKSRFVRGRRGTAGGGRKAYVYLKPGEKIEIA